VADKDVIGKVDALMRRHSIPLPGAGGDAADVPVLTDVIEPAADPTRAADTGPDLAEAIFEQVMKEVDGRLVSGLAGLREELTRSIREAIRQELERRQIK
jgi:U3 small nucleolar ribonucleoprotein component